MMTYSTTVRQWLHSSEKQPELVSKRTAEILHSTTIHEWNHVQSADNPADASNRGIAASAFLEYSCLKTPDFPRTSDWPFKPPNENVRKIRLTKLATETKSSSELQNASTFTATVTTNASAFEWLKYSSYEKLLRIAAYVLFVLPKFSGHRTTDGSITDPNELMLAEQKLFFKIQLGCFNAEKECLMKDPPSASLRN